MQNISPESVAKIATNVENLSGTWIGQCYNEPLRLTITQDDKVFFIEFNDDENGETEKLDFSIGKVVNNNEASSSDNKITVRYASLNHYDHLDFTSVSLVSYDFINSTTQSSGILATETMFLDLTKEGHTLKLHDIESSESCVLTKQ